MRILFLESMQNLIFGLANGFRDAGHKIMISGPITRQNVPRMKESFQPELVIAIVCNEENTKIYQEWVSEYLHIEGVPLVYWLINDLAFTKNGSQPQIHWLKPDFVFTICPSRVEEYKQRGIKADYMDFGYNPSIHYQEEVSPKYQSSISVVANIYPDVLEKDLQPYLYTSLQTLIVPLLLEGVRVDFWGRNWDQMSPFLGVEIPHDWIHGYIPYKEINYVYSSAKIIIGMQNHTHHLTQQTFEILASGGLLLTNDTPAVRQVFKPGQDLIASSSPTETIKLVRHYLRHPEECDLLRKQGKSAVTHHSYRNRAEFMIRTLIKEGILHEKCGSSEEDRGIYYYENYAVEKYQLYIVKPSDTLWRLSKKFGVTINQLKEMNNLKSDEIFVDQVLKISEIINSAPYIEKIYNDIAQEEITGGPQATRWAKAIVEAAEKHQVPGKILYSMMVAESNGNPNLVAKTGGIGLMQLHIETANLLGVNPCDPIQSIDGAARYLKELYYQFGDWKFAVAAYNAGPEKVKKYGGIPPTEGSQNYVWKVFSFSEAIDSEGDEK